MAAKSIMLSFVFMIGAGAASIQDEPEKTDVMEVKTRLQDVLEFLVMKLKQQERACDGSVVKKSDKTTGARVAFTVQLSEPTEFKDLVKFDHVVSNRGNGYNPITGVFTAPYSGTYVFSLTMMSKKKYKCVHVNIMKGGDTILGKVFAGDTASDWVDSASTTVAADLEKDDVVYVQEFHEDAIVFGEHYCSFTGFLLN